MASSIPQMIGTVLGAAAKELISNNPPTKSGHYVPNNRNRNADQDFKKNTRHYNHPRSDVNSKKVVKTLEKLVDAKEEALTQEMIRRRKAEIEVMDLQKQLKKVQVTDDRKKGDSTVKKDPSSGKNKPHYRPDGTGGGGRGGYTKSVRGGYNNTTNRTGYGKSNQPAAFTINVNVDGKTNNFKRGSYNKVYNKQPIPGCTMQQRKLTNPLANQLTNNIHK